MPPKIRALHCLHKAKRWVAVYSCQTPFHQKAGQSCLVQLRPVPNWNTKSKLKRYLDEGKIDSTAKPLIPLRAGNVRPLLSPPQVRQCPRPTLWRPWASRSPTVEAAAAFAGFAHGTAGLAVTMPGCPTGDALGRLTGAAGGQPGLRPWRQVPAEVIRGRA